MSNANQPANRYSKTRRESYPNLLLSVGSYSNTSFLRSNNLTNHMSTLKLQTVDLSFSSQILEYNKICRNINEVNGSYNPHVSTVVGRAVS